jgi:hypothetical protein
LIFKIGAVSQEADTVPDCPVIVIPAVAENAGIASFQGERKHTAGLHYIVFNFIQILELHAQP